ncbi:MAG: family 1 glycosylhydrolase, partial [Lachnospiraceae bacterium]|nr:family 1 glycosylhydrolase [Lachnospiraceae bacterium]
MHWFRSITAGLEDEKYPQFKMGNMICFILSYPMTCNPDDVLANEMQMRQMNWYCSDVMVRGEYPSYAEAVWKKNGVKPVIQDGDLEDIKNGTV